MTTETKAQAQVRLGRNLADLSPETRLAYFYAADQKDPEPEQAEPAVVDDGFNAAQRAFLKDRDPSALDLTDREVLHGLRLVHDRPEDKATPASAPPPFALDVDKINAAGLSAGHRLQIADAFDLAERGMAQARAGLHPSARTVQQHQVDSALTMVRPFLVRAA